MARQQTHRLRLRTLRLGAIVMAVLFLGGWNWLRSEDPDIKSGNKAFNDGDYAQALKDYEAALERSGDDPRVRFDMGTARFKLAEKTKDAAEKAKLLSDADKDFRAAARTKNKTLRSSAHFNQGNSHFLRKDYLKAIESYKRALRNNADSDDARYNLELALRHLKRKRQRQAKKGQGKGQPKKGQKGQKGQQKKNQQGQGKNQQKQQQKNQQGQGKNQQKKQQQKKNQQGQGKNQQKKNQQKKNQGQGNNQNKQNKQPNKQNKSQKPNQKNGRPWRKPPRKARNEPKSEIDKKMDDLERRSRRLRRGRLRGSGRYTGKSRKDW